MANVATSKALAANRTAVPFADPTLAVPAILTVAFPLLNGAVDELDIDGGDAALLAVLPAIANTQALLLTGSVVHIADKKGERMYIESKMACVIIESQELSALGPCLDARLLQEQHWSQPILPSSCQRTC